MFVQKQTHIGDVLFELERSDFMRQRHLPCAVKELRGGEQQATVDGALLTTLFLPLNHLNVATSPKDVVGFVSCVATASHVGAAAQPSCCLGTGASA